MTKDSGSSLPHRRDVLGAAIAASAAALAPALPARAQETTRPVPASVSFRSVEHLVGSSVNFAYAAKAGPWLFLNGQEGYDFAKGEVPEVEGAAGFPEFGSPPLRREAKFLIERMGRTLKEFGADLQHSVRVDQWYTDGDAVRAYHLERFAGFGTYVPPSTSIIMERCFGAESHMSTALIAVMPADDWKIEVPHSGTAATPVLSGYAPAVTCNDFVFAAGQMATEMTPQGSAMAPAAQVNPNLLWSTPRPIRVQTEIILQKLDATLKAAGSSLDNCVKVEAHVAGADNFPDFLEVWGKRFHDNPCAVTVVPAKGFAERAGIIEINVVALKNGARRKKQVVRADIPAMAAYGPCLRAGELVFPSGLMPIGRDGRVVGLEQGKKFDGLCLSGQIQAAAIYSYADAICKAAGTTMQNAVRADYFVSDIKEFPGVAMAWSSRYGNAPHPFSCVVSPPPMPAPGATVMADFWIYAG